MNGILLVDKPLGKTSHDVVQEIRRDREERRVGHAGTLDPLATGLLVVALGKGLRLMEFMIGWDKTYTFEVLLGELTDTDDTEGKPEETRPVPTRGELESKLATLVGEIDQRPPRYSAVKVAGRKLYEYARAGETVEAPLRRVTIHKLTLEEYEPPRARFLLRCSKGFYVRSIARELGGHVTVLRRTASGPFRVEDAGPDLLPLDVAVMNLPEARLSSEETLQFEQGALVERECFGMHRVYCGPRFIGIGEGLGSMLKPRKVILA